MARYRQIHLSFWQDGFILELTPEEKYFYLYLMSNSKTNQCGIYELPKKVMEIETGYSRETIEKLLKRFIEYGKIAYCEAAKEIIILNWVKYNFIESPKVLNCIQKELANVKNKEFIKLFFTVCKRHGHRIDSLCIDLGEEKEEEEKTRTCEEHAADSVSIKTEKNTAVAEISSLLQGNGFGVITPLLADKIRDLADEYTVSWVKEAVSIAVTKNKRSLSYVEGILRRGRAEGTLKLCAKGEKGGKDHEQTGRGSPNFGCAETGKYDDFDFSRFLYND